MREKTDRADTGTVPRQAHGLGRWYDHSTNSICAQQSRKGKPRDMIWRSTVHCTEYEIPRTELGLAPRKSHVEALDRLDVFPDASQNNNNTVIIQAIII